MSVCSECDSDGAPRIRPQLFRLEDQEQARDTYDYDVISVGLPLQTKTGIHPFNEKIGPVPSSPLRDNLPSLIPEGRVLGLDFAVVDLQARHNYEQALDSLALALLDQICNARVGVKRPITWITHGFGGLIVKKALLIATTRKKYFDIAFRTRSLVFFGTPHFCDSSTLWDQVTLYMVASNAMSDHIHGTSPRAGQLKPSKLSKVMEKTSTEFLRIAKLYRIVNFVPTDQPPAFEHRYTHLSLAGREMDTVTLNGNFISMMDYSNWSDDTLFRFQELAEPNLVGVPDDDYIQLLYHLWTLQESFYLWGVHDFPPEIATSPAQQRFQDWLLTGESGLFYLFGRSGAGKTSYMSSFFKTLYSPVNQRGVDQSQVLVSFFHDDAREGAGLFRPMATMLLFQILSQRPHLAQRIHDYWKEARDTRTTSTAMLLAVIKAILQPPFPDEIVLVLDGIDDWTPPPLDFLQKVIDTAIDTQVQLKIVMSGDRYRGDELHLGSGWGRQKVCLDMPITQDQTRLAFYARMVEELIAERPEYHIFRQLLLDKFKELDLTYLECSRASHLLSRSRTPSIYGTMKEEANLIPRKLEDLYSLLVERSDPRFHDITFEAFSWILFVERPLTDAELACAMASKALQKVDMKETNLGSVSLQGAIESFQNAYPMNIRHDLDLCTDPRMFQGASDHIRVRHGTLKKYLLERSKGPFVWSSSQHSLLTERCLRYLKVFLSTDHGDSMVQGIPQNDFLHYAAQYWPRHYRLAPPNSELDQIVIAFFRDARLAWRWQDIYRQESYGYKDPAARSGYTDSGLDIQLASECGLMGVVQSLLSSQTEANGTGGREEKYTDQDINFAIDLASVNGHQGIVELLCSSFQLYGHLALCNAALGRHLETMRFLLDLPGAMLDLNEPGFEGQTPLGIACLMGCVEIVNVLLDPRYDVDLEAQTPQGSTPLIAASAMGYASIVDLLVGRGANVLHRDKLGKSPIWYAAHWGHADVATILEKAGADVKDVDSKGLGLLHGAVVRSFSGFARYNTAEARLATTSDGMTALHLACEQGQLLAVQALLYAPTNGSEIHDEPTPVDKAFVNKARQDGRTALHIAAERGFVYTVNMLLAAGADTESTTSSGYTALQLAAKEGRLHVMKLLAGETSKRQHPRPPLLPLAAETGQFLAVRYLLRLHESPSKPDIRGRIPLSLAAEGGHLAVVRLLLKSHKALINSRDYYGWTPLHYASSRGHAAVVDILLRNGADLSAIAISNPNPVYKDSLRIDPSAPPTPIKATKSNKFPLQRGRYGPCRCTALHLAAMHAPVLARLLEAGADPRAEDVNGFTPLHLAALAGGPEEISLLADKTGVEIGARNLEGDSPLHIAAWNGRCENIRCLLAKGASPATVDNAQRAPLHLAVLSRSLEAVELLMAHEDNKKRVTGRGNSFLHLAVAVDSLKIAAKLLDWRVPIDATDANGCTPLYDAVHDQRTEMVELLVSCKADIDKSDIKGRVPLHISYGSPQIARFLLENGANVNKRTRNGATALHFACVNGAMEAARILVENGADLNAQDDLGQTPLISASSSDSEFELDGSPDELDLTEESATQLAQERMDKARLAITELLLGDERCKPDLLDRFGRSPLHLAALNNLPEVVDLLCSRLDVDIRSKNLSTPLHFAAHGTSLAVVEVLCQHGADAMAQDVNGATSLHLAMIQGNVDLVDSLLARDGARLVSHQDKEGCTALVIATYYHHYRLVHRLTEFEAGREAINTPTKLGYTPLLVAVESGDDTMVNLLLDLESPAHCDATTTTRDGRTALILAAKGGFSNIVDDLLWKRREETLCIMETVWDTLGGLTALQTALEMHNLDIASTLVREGANVTTLTGMSPLFTAALCNSALMEQMLDKNPKLLTRGNGFDELRMAVEAGSVVLWDRFVSAARSANITGALHSVDKDGWTLQMIISQSKDQDFQKRLHGLPNVDLVSRGIEKTTSPRLLPAPNVAPAWSEDVKCPTTMIRQWPEIGDDEFAGDVQIEDCTVRYTPESQNAPPLTLRSDFAFKPGSSSKTSYFSITILPPDQNEQRHRTFPQTNTETTGTSQGESPLTSPTTKGYVSSPRQGRALQRRSTSPLSQLRGTSRSSTLLAGTGGSSSRNTSRDGPTRRAPPCIVIGVCGQFANLRRALPGREAGSFGYHGDDGYFYYKDIAGAAQRERLGPTFGVPGVNTRKAGALSPGVPSEDGVAGESTTVAMDEHPGREHELESGPMLPATTVGCAVCWESDTISFYLNGVLVGERKSKKLRRKLYPVVGFLNGPVTVKIDLNSNGHRE